MSFSIGKKAPRTRSYANWIKGIEAVDKVLPTVTVARKPRVRKAAPTAIASYMVDQVSIREQAAFVLHAPTGLLFDEAS